jgi:integrase
VRRAPEVGFSYDYLGFNQGWSYFSEDVEAGSRDHPSRPSDSAARHRRATEERRSPNCSQHTRGFPWTETGFNASFRTFKKELGREGLIGTGLTPHGLRHTLGARLREAGADNRTIADILEQKSTSMAQHYSEGASLPEQARALFAGVDPTRRQNGT